MEAAKHTPGPWMADGPWTAGRLGNCAPCYGVVTPKGEMLVGGALFREEKANAYLIAAAPELLAALKQLSAMVDAGQSPDYAALQEHQVMRLARAAIAKALGETV